MLYLGGFPLNFLRLKGKTKWNSRREYENPVLFHPISHIYNTIFFPILMIVTISDSSPTIIALSV